MSCCVHICVNWFFFFLQVRKKSLFSENRGHSVCPVCLSTAQSASAESWGEKRESSFPKQFLPNFNSFYAYFDIPNQPSCPESSYNIFLFCYRPISFLVLFCFMCILYCSRPSPCCLSVLHAAVISCSALLCSVPSLWSISSLCPPPSVPVLPISLWQHDCVSCVLFCEFLIRPLPVANLISSASIKRLCLCH